MRPMTQPKHKASRRAPQQERSKVTADAIIEAAARVFVDVGVEQSTTVQIAVRAGVSVGSLYQYFPNKHALLVALYDRESERLEAVLQQMLIEIGFEDTTTLIRAYVSRTLEVFETNADLYRLLLDEVPRTAGLELHYRIDDRGIAALRPLLALGADRIQPRDPDVAAALIVRTYRYNTVAALRHPMSAAQRTLFVDELTAMLSNYLFGARRDAPAP